MRVITDGIILGHVHLASLPDTHQWRYESSQGERRDSAVDSSTRWTRAREWLAAVEAVVALPYWTVLLLVIWVMYTTLLYQSIRAFLGSERLAQIERSVLLGFA